MEIIREYFGDHLVDEYEPELESLLEEIGYGQVDSMIAEAVDLLPWLAA